MTSAHEAERVPRRRYVATNDWNLAAHEPPPPEQLQEWLKAYRETGSHEARNSVVESHLRLVARSARKYANKAIAFDDLMAEGAIALLRALENFDPERGVPFTAYATAVIDHTLRGSAVRARDLVKIPGPERRRVIAKLREQDQRYLQHGERLPEQSSPASVDATSPERTSTWRPKMVGPTVQVGHSAGDTDSLVDSASSPGERVELDDQVRELKDAVKRLPALDRRALCMRFGLFGEAERTASAMARELSLSPRQLDLVLMRASRALRMLMGEAGTRLN